MSSENRLSYTISAWQRLKSVCSAVQQTETHASTLKAGIEAKLQSTARTRKKKADVQGCELELGHLRGQIDWRKSRVRTLTSRFVKLRGSLEKRENEAAIFVDEKTKLQLRRVAEQRAYLSLRESMLRTSALLLLRRKQMLQEIYDCIFPINVPTTNSAACSCQQSFHIANIHLPDAESYAGHDEQAIAIALSNVAHYMLIISRILNLPLRYSILLFGSRSAVEDHISEKLVDMDRVFPLFGRGQDKLRYAYAVFLLNKNIAQFRCFCALSTKDLRRTLSNLKDLIEFLIGAKLEPQYQMRPLSVMHMSGSALALGDVARGSKSIKVGVLPCAGTTRSTGSEVSSFGSSMLSGSLNQSPVATSSDCFSSGFPNSVNSIHSDSNQSFGAIGKFDVVYDQSRLKDVGRKKAYTVAVGADCPVIVATAPSDDGKVSGNGTVANIASHHINKSKHHQNSSSATVTTIDPHCDSPTTTSSDSAVGVERLLNESGRRRGVHQDVSAENGYDHQPSPSVCSTAASSATQSSTSTTHSGDLVGGDGGVRKSIGGDHTGNTIVIQKQSYLLQQHGIPGEDSNPPNATNGITLTEKVTGRRNSAQYLEDNYSASALPATSVKSGSRSESVIVEALGSELTFVEQFAKNNSMDSSAADDEQIRRGKLIGAEFHVNLNTNS